MSYAEEVKLNKQLDMNDRELLLEFIEQLQTEMEGYDQCTCATCEHEYNRASVVLDILLDKVAK